jgi:hypothetical protein
MNEDTFCYLGLAWYTITLSLSDFDAGEPMASPDPATQPRRIPISSAALNSAPPTAAQSTKQHSAGADNSLPVNMSSTTSASATNSNSGQSGAKESSVGGPDTKEEREQRLANSTSTTKKILYFNKVGP